jgi:hypothetical protein
MGNSFILNSLIATQPAPEMFRNPENSIWLFWRDGFLGFWVTMWLNLGTMLKQLVRLAVLFLILAAGIQRPAAERILAVGDVHGNLDAFVALLQKSGFIDQGLHWTARRSTLVQVGDMVDRGPKSRATLDFLIALQSEASKQGGSVRISLGNHEVMNIMGDMRYVGPQDYASFANNRSEQRRSAALRDYSRFQAKRESVVDETIWLQAHPLGFFEHREAFGSQGKYGKWLRNVPVINKIGDSAFLHGGINPALNVKSVDQINTAVRAEMQLFDQIVRYMVDNNLALPFFTLEELMKAASDEVEKTKLKPLVEQTDADRARIQILDALLQSGAWLMVHNDGPLWFRGYDRWSDAEGEPQLAPLALTLGVKRFIVGHTIQENGEVRSRFGGMVFLIDTGLVAGRASALEIANGRIRALYMDKQTELN